MFKNAVEGSVEFVGSHIHEVLIVVSFIPIIGWPADALNSVIYLAQGDIFDGVLAAACVIPGGAAFAYGMKTKKSLQLSNRVAHSLNYADSVSVGFGKGAKEVRAGIETLETIRYANIGLRFTAAPVGFFSGIVELGIAKEENSEESIKNLIFDNEISMATTAKYMGELAGELLDMLVGK